MLKHGEMTTVVEYLHAYIGQAFRRHLRMRHRYHLILPSPDNQHRFRDSWKSLYIGLMHAFLLSK